MYELNPLACPQCGGEMIVVAFIEPPQREVIERILKHCGLWEGSSARPPPPLGDPAHRDREVIACRSRGGPHELTYVNQDTFEAMFSAPYQVGLAQHGPRRLRRSHFCTSSLARSHVFCSRWQHPLTADFVSASSAGAGVARSARRS